MGALHVWEAMPYCSAAQLSSPTALKQRPISKTAVSTNETRMKYRGRKKYKNKISYIERERETEREDKPIIKLPVLRLGIPVLCLIDEFRNLKSLCCKRQRPFGNSSMPNLQDGYYMLLIYIFSFLRDNHVDDREVFNPRRQVNVVVKEPLG